MSELKSSTGRKWFELFWKFWPLLLIGGVWLVFFWPMLTGKTVVGFRDSAYLYYPYFKWIDSQWAAGQIPLWNPYCDLGHPVVADGTSSVFYPGKLVFFFRFLSYPSRYGIYIAIHVLLAAIGACCFAQRLGATDIGTALAGFSYAFGGSVLFQTTNVVYLVSASLLPFSLMFVWQMNRRWSVGSAVAAGVFCALMVLGGDPQMAYLVGLIAAVSFVGRAICVDNKKTRLKRFFFNSAASRAFLIRGLTRLIVLAVVTFVLSAVQVLPTYYWAKQSERESSGLERLASIFSKPTADSALDSTLQFSQPPWSIAELFCPNVSGQPFPINQRWASCLPGADRIWTPSLYAGLITMLLAISSLRFWGGQRKKVWLTWLCLFFGIGSFGWFGAVWLYNEIAISLGGKGLPDAGEQVGGIYWLMLVCLPKFYLFRYPAKLFVIASLAICLLASLALKKSVSPRPSLVAAIVSAIGVAALTICNPFSHLSYADQMFGPFDNGAAYNSAYYSLVQMFVVSFGLLVFCFAGRAAVRNTGAKHFFAAGLLFLAATELLVANYWLVPQVDAQRFEETTSIERKFKALRENRLPPRFVRGYGTPGKWKIESSSSRLAEIAQWQRETLHPKNNLAVPCRLFGSFASIDSNTNRKFSGSLIEEMAISNNPVEYASQFQVNGAVNFGSDLTAGIKSGNEAGLWFVPQNEDLRRLDTEWTTILSSRRVMKWKYELLEFSNYRVRVKVDALEPAIVIYNSLPEAGWRCEVKSLPVGKLIENSQLRVGSRYFMMARIPAGETEIAFEYSPTEFWVGAWISVAGWLSLFVYWIRKKCLRPLI